MENKPNIDLLEEAVEEAANLSFIDEGGFKAVYKATIAGRIEALKVIFIPRENDQEQEHSEILPRVKREIESLKLCECPYIVKLGNLLPRLCVIQNLDYLIYSEELLEGQTLHERIRTGHIPDLEECKTLLICLLKVIQELKTIDIIHRDIKPKNIFALNDTNRPYVILDLGIAFKLHSTAITKNPDYRLGTLPYMAPEMFQPQFRQHIDYRSDLYSAAITVYEYAASLHPLASREEDDFTTIYRIAHSRPSPLFSHRSDLSSSFCLIIDYMIRKKPALRPSNLEELIEKLEAI